MNEEQYDQILQGPREMIDSLALEITRLKEENDTLKKSILNLSQVILDLCNTILEKDLKARHESFKTMIQ